MGIPCAFWERCHGIIWDIVCPIVARYFRYIYSNLPRLLDVSYVCTNKQQREKVDVDQQRGKMRVNINLTFLPFLSPQSSEPTLTLPPPSRISTPSLQSPARATMSSPTRTGLSARVLPFELLLLASLVAVGAHADIITLNSTSPRIQYQGPWSTSDDFRVSLSRSQTFAVFWSGK